MDLNKVQLIGRATNNLEVKTIESSGTSVVNFTIVTNRKFKNRDGNVVEDGSRCIKAKPHPYQIVCLQDSILFRYP